MRKAKKREMTAGEGPLFAAGVDVGGTKVSTALFDSGGRMFARAKQPLDRGSGEAAAGQVARVLRELGEEAVRAGGRVKAAAVCIPGIVYQADGLVWAPNVPGWIHFPLQGRLEGAVPFPVLIESDRAAYVSGEAWRGAARGARDAVFLAVGTGIGAGIISGGRLIRGAEDISGAVGWFALRPEFREEYAEMGCFEAEASGTGVGRRARRLLESGVSSEMIRLAGGRIADVTAETVAAAARLNDPPARAIMAETASTLAMGIANIVSLLNPKVIVLGGGLFQAADLLLEPIRKEIKKWAQPLAAKDLEVAVSTLGEDAGLYGCGKLAWDLSKGE
ncbi:MAG TPA: ROK family protein [Candidatus Aminicenantes bacterium]|nr:ROK family protein [Candidatus Aminicenantes bacterium]